MVRLGREEIASEVFDFLEEYLGGEIVEFHNQTGGYSNGAAAKVVSASGQRAFVKIATAASGGRTFGLYQDEARILRSLPPELPVPPLLALYETHNWIALVIESVDGRSPTTPDDFAAVVSTVSKFPPVPNDSFPSVAATYSFLETSWAKVPNESKLLSEWSRKNRKRLSEVAARGLQAIDGEYLVHGDLRPDNVLIDDRGKVWLVDWPYALRGARWFDPLLFMFDASLSQPKMGIHHVLQTHELFANVPDQDIDALLSGYAAYSILASSQPLDGVSQELRDFQANNAKALLSLLQERWCGPSTALDTVKSL